MRKKKCVPDVQCFTDSAALPPEWDALLPSGHYLKKEQLAVSERSALPDVGYIYVLTLKDGKPVSAASFQTLRLKKHHLNNTMVKPYQSLLWQLFTTSVRPVMLIAGHLFRHDVCSFYRDSSLSPFDAFGNYRKAIDTAQKRTCAMAVLVKDVDEQLTTYFQHYAPEYLLLRNDISMEMDIPASWTSMTDYEKALKHKYAQRYRKVSQAWSSLRITELSLEEITENKQDLYELYMQVSSKQQVRLGFLSPDYLVQLKAHYGPLLKVWAVYEEDRMIAFFSAWVRDDVFDMFYIGFDYEQNGRLQLYFNMLFFGVQHAIALRKEKLVLGRTALDAKARIGCKPRYLHTFLYIKNSLVRREVLRIQQRNNSNEGEWEQRHPFKPPVNKTES